MPAITNAERGAGLPPLLLQSIAVVESGRRDPASNRVVPWPWTINVAGTGYFYATKDEAISAVRAFQANGIRSIDVGCAQVNLQYHPDAFPSLESAFDPETNVNYAARFLTLLFGTTRSWPLAAAYYHSQVPERGFAYARKVLAIWPGSGRYGVLPAISTPATTRPAVDESIYTTAFAAQVRRIDQDVARSVRSGPAPGPAWIAQTPGRLSGQPYASGRAGQRGSLRVADMRDTLR